jgi:hypothetical protein
LGFYYNSGSVGIGFEFGLGAADYCYVPSTRFCDPHVRSYCLPAHQNVIVHKDTTVINNYVVGRNNQIINNGAGIDKIARVTRGDVKRVALKDTSSVKNLGTRHDRLESDGSTLTVYRPPSSTLARKSVVSSAGQPAVSVSRPPSAVHPAGSVRSSTVSGPAPAASTTTTPVAPAVGAGAKADANPRSGNSRTTPSPVTVYTRPTTASREPVIVTGGVEPVKPYAKPDVQGATRAERLGTETPQVANPNVAGGVRSHESTVSKDASGQTRPSSGGYSKPGTESGSASASGVSSSRTSAKPAAGSASATSSGYSAPAKSGYTRADASPAYTKPAAASSSGSSPAYTRPTTVAPSHNPSYATPSAGYVAPSRVETHHSQVAAPSGGHSGGQSSGGGSAPSVAPSGSSGGSHAKPDAPPSSGDSKKRR